MRRPGDKNTALDRLVHVRADTLTSQQAPSLRLGRARGTMKPNSEDSLRLAFERLAAGDLGALETIYDSCAADLYGYAAWKTGRCDDAADLVQETFVRLAERGQRLAEVRRPRPYLLTMVNRAAIDLARSRARTGEDPRDFAYLQAAETHVDLRVDASTTSRRIAQLPPKQREALYLRFFAELTFREIGKVCGVPTFTAASRCRLGLSRLRRLMGVNDET